MAEWSKALDLSSSIRKNAQVRTLQEALLLGIEPKPNRCCCTRKQETQESVLVAQWIGRETTNLEIGGSSPSEDGFRLEWSSWL